MPLELRAPRKGKTPCWTVRGTYLGVHVERSTKTSSKRLAQQFLKKWEREIERGEFATENEPTFLAAAVNYMKASGERKFVKRLLDHFGELPLRLINQAAVDAAAVEIYPRQTPATRNRQVYTPVSAILMIAKRSNQMGRQEDRPSVAVFCVPDEGKILSQADIVT